MESDRKVHEFKGDDELQEALISGYKFNQGDFVEMPEDFDENKTIATYVVDYAVEEDCVNLIRRRSDLPPKGDPERTCTQKRIYNSTQKCSLTLDYAESKEKKRIVESLKKAGLWDLCPQSKDEIEIPRKLEEGELGIFCNTNLDIGSKIYYETIKQIDGENEERVLMQRFDSRTGERVLWIIYGSCLDNPVFNDYKKSLVKFGKWKGGVVKKRRA